MLQIEQFINEGYVKLPDAFPRELAEQVRSVLWKDMGCLEHDPSTWTKPVIRLGYYDQEPFRKAVNTPVLLSAFDQLVGEGKWFPRNNLGTFPVRFPSMQDPGDTGWHVDSGFAGPKPDDFSTWRVNVRSKGRALLMLFLFSDIGEDDAPTRLRVGSHADVARLLLSYGDEGLSFMELAGQLDKTSTRPEVSATGTAGTVFLCHPFIVHAAQAHRGQRPRFLAQPPLGLNGQLHLDGHAGTYSALETSIRKALGWID